MNEYESQTRFRKRFLGWSAFGIVAFIQLAPAAIYGVLVQRGLQVDLWTLVTLTTLFQVLLIAAAAAYPGGPRKLIRNLSVSPAAGGLSRALALVIPLRFLLIPFAVAWAAFLASFGVEPETMETVRFALEGSWQDFNFLVLHALIFAPLTEEILFRGWLYDGVESYVGEKPAVIMVSFFFALIHWSPTQLLPLFILALALQRLRRMYGGSLLPSMLLHFLFNAISMAGVLAMRLLQVEIS